VYHDLDREFSSPFYAIVGSPFGDEYESLLECSLFVIITAMFSEAFILPAETLR
jgi:hypothetical protein